MITFQSSLLSSLRAYSASHPNTTKSIIWLIGYNQDDDDVVILSGIRSLSADGTGVVNVPNDEQAIRTTIPGGLHIFGLYIYDASPTRQSDQDAINAVLKTLHGDIINPNSFCVAGVNKFGADVLASREDEVIFYRVSALISFSCCKIGDTLENATISTTSASVGLRSVMVPVHVTATVQFLLVQKQGKLNNKVSEQIVPLLSSTDLCLFAVKGNAKNTIVGAGINTDKLPLELITAGSENKDPLVHLIVLESLSPNAAIPCSPTLFHQQLDAETRMSDVEVMISVCYYVPLKQPLYSARAGILAYVQAQIRLMASLFDENVASASAPPTVLHFCPSGFSHIITAVYPINRSVSNEDNDHKLEKLRSVYHQRLPMLPSDHPAIRLGNALAFGPRPVTYEPISKGPKTIVTVDSILADVHLQLGTVSRTKGALSLVKGSYLYYHYNQGIDDSGWGCAYRSLQTICSWMLLQGYTTRPVPSHRQIQEILVALNDKPQSFLGSSNWIGAVEVGMCLDYLYGVSSRILNVSSGADLAFRGAELSAHFEMDGTPIMIGGGVLAYTLLGVDYNESTGDIKFLVSMLTTGGFMLKWFMF